MAQKRKAQEAFGGGKGRLSAFAAAKLARQSGNSPARSPEPDPTSNADSLAAEVATVPYNGHHSRTSSPDAASVEEEVSITSSKKGPPTQLSSFKPTKDNVVQDDNEGLELVLQHDETVTSIGEYDLTVLTGIITVYGTVLRPDTGPQRVYAPSTAAFPQIQARQQSTVIRLSAVKSSLSKLERLSPLFRNIWASDLLEGRSFALLGTATDDASQRSLTGLNIGQEMDAVLRTLSAKTAAEPQKPRIMAVGAAATGKSTFNRTLCNHLNSWTPAQKCFYLDLDPGQPEFGPPRQISLVEVSAPILGPSFTHPATPRSSNYRLIRSHCLAATTSRDDPEYYKNCALDLIKHADPRYPLIVSSCGWITGQGATLLAEFTYLLGITDIVLLEPLDTNLVNMIRMASNDVSFHRMPRQPPKHSSRTAAESRTMLTMAYFHYRLTASNSVPRWSGKPMNMIRPWVVSYAGSDSGIFAIMCYGQNPTPEFLTEVLNGSIVAISVQDNDEDALCSTTNEDLAEHIARTPEDIPYITPDDHGISRTLDPRTSHCAGFAFVRGINTSDKEIHLVTPLRESDIAAFVGKKMVLIRCGSDPPDWAYLEELYRNGDNKSLDESERPWVSKKGMVGVEGAVWRLRHPPMASTIAASR